MKKNRMMRLASTLLILTLLTTSAVSGTFARYTSSADATDTARVAKWGVTVAASGTLFGAHYNAVGDGNEIAASTTFNVDLETSGSGNIVAPGTKNTTGLTLTVVGQPEVQNTVAVTMVESGKYEDIWLAEGSYGVLVEATGVTEANFTNYYIASGTDSFVKATAPYDSLKTYYELRDKVSVDSGVYYPITWYIDGTSATAKTTAALFDEFAAKFTKKANKANEDIADNHKITWEWPIDGNDGADTILGNLSAAGGNYVVVKTSDSYVNCSKLVEDTDYNLTVYFDAKITVTQVD